MREMKEKDNQNYLNLFFFFFSITDLNNTVEYRTSSACNSQNEINMIITFCTE